MVLLVTSEEHHSHPLVGDRGAGDHDVVILKIWNPKRIPVTGYLFNCGTIRSVTRVEALICTNRPPIDRKRMTIEHPPFARAPHISRRGVGDLELGLRADRNTYSPTTPNVGRAA
jgi:hypothetical protein